MAFFDYKCNICGAEDLIDRKKMGPLDCPCCQNKECFIQVFGAPHIRTVSGPGANSEVMKSVDKDEHVWHQEANAQTQKENEARRDLFKKDEHWHREFNRGEIGHKIKDEAKKHAKRVS